MIEQNLIRMESFVSDIQDQLQISPLDVSREYKEANTVMVDFEQDHQISRIMEFDKIQSREQPPAKPKASIFKEYLQKSDNLNKAESMKSFENQSQRDQSMDMIPQSLKKEKSGLRKNAKDNSENPYMKVTRNTGNAKKPIKQQNKRAASNLQPPRNIKNLALSVVEGRRIDLTDNNTSKNKSPNSVKSARDEQSMIKDINRATENQEMQAQNRLKLQLQQKPQELEMMKKQNEGM